MITSREVAISRLRWLRYLAPIAMLSYFTHLAPVVAQDTDRWDIFSSKTPGAGPVGDVITSLALDGNTLWVGTTEGLSRYDGGVWDTYDTMDGLPEKEVRAMLIDQAGNLWIATEKSVLLLGPERRWADRRVLTSGPNQVQTLSLGGDGGVWIGTLSGATYRSLGGTEQRNLEREPPRATIEAIWEEGPGDVWFGTRGSGLVRLRSDGVYTYTEVHGLPSVWVHSLWGNNQGDLWVGTEEGACRISPMDRDTDCQPLDQVQGLAVTGLYPGPGGSLWLATDLGLLRFEGDELQETLRPTSTTGGGLRSDDVRAVVQDAEGQLWIGTTAGLARRRASIWRQLLPQTLDLAEKNVQAIAEDAAGDLWIATNRGVKWRDANRKWHTIPDLADQATHCLWAEADGGVWVCLDQGLARVSHTGQVERSLDDAGADVKVEAIQRGADHALWLATGQGVWRWNGSDWTSYRQDTPSGGPVNNAVYSIAPDRMSGLWFGTLGGLSHFDGHQWVNSADSGCQVTTGIIRALAWEPPGRLWGGTDTQLILCADGQQQDWDLRDDLGITVPIRSLALETADPRSPDRTGETTLWLGTFEGLSRLRLPLNDPQKLQVVSFTGESLPHDRVQAIHVSPRYGVLIGTPNGLWAYQPSRVLPQVSLSHQGNILPRDASLELEYNEPVLLRAVGGDLRTPAEELIYRYEIGREDETLKGWLFKGENEIPIDNLLRPGDVARITVQAYDRDFNASANPAQLEVIRHLRPLPLRPWFIGSMVLLIATGTVGIYYGLRVYSPNLYHDLRVTIIPTEQAGWVIVRLDARRITLLPPVGPLSRLGRWLPPVGRLRKVPLPASDPVNITPLEEIKGMSKQVGSDPSDTERLRFMGTRLYKTLFTEKSTDVLCRHLGLGRQGLRLRLPFASHSQLAGLPWELLHGGDDLGFLGQQANTLLVRYVEPDQEWERPRIGKKLRVLVVMAQPQGPGVEPLGLVEEKARLDKILTAIKQVDVDYLYGVHAAELVGETTEARDLPEQMEEWLAKGWDVLHFVGHAGRDRLARPPEQAEVVLWCEDRRGDYLALRPHRLGRLLKELVNEGKGPKLVVLNACDTANIESELLGAILDSGVGAVIGMQWPVLDVAAQAFAESFYRTLGRHGRVDYAVSVARSKIVSRMEGTGRHDWAAPVLVMQTPDGRIFERP